MRSHVVLKLLRILRHSTHGKQWDRELSEEMEAHREMKRRALEKEGYNAVDVESAIRRDLGNVTQMKEESRAVWIWPWLEGLAQDFRMEVRQLSNARGFTVTAVAILALGIGLNSAVFTVLNGVALRPFPLPHPEQLTYVMEQQGDGCCSPPSWLDQRDIREQQRTFQSLAAYSYDNNFLVTAQKQTRHFVGGYVTADYFATLGVRPVAGRVFTADEAKPGRDHVVLLREDFWRSEFGNKADNDFSILGTTMLVNGVKCDVIGILPAWFGFPSEDAVIWTPLVPTTVQATQRGWHGFPMVGRIKPGVSLSAAKADLNVIMSRLSHRYSGDRDRVGAIFPLRTWGLEDSRSRLLVLQFAALGIFLMTCANVSSLLLARYSARRREYALRAALGASRLRQVRQHLTEALLLALLGCTAGIAIAWAGVKFLLRLYQDRLPRISGISVDWHLVLFMAGVTLAGAVVFGFTTALHENATELERSLRENSRSSSGRRGLRLRRFLVIAQMACAVALLAGSGELIQSFWYLMHVDTGLDTSHVLTMRVDLPNVRYNSPDSVAAFYDRAMNRIRSVPGVQNAASINLLPVAQSGRNSDVEVAELPPHSNMFFAENRNVAGDYFATMSIPILRGRNFLPEEMSGKEKAVIINQTMARSLWKDKDPIGYRLRGFGNSDEWFTVVGVSRDVHQAGLNQPVESELFAPLRTSDEPLTTQFIVVRSRTDAPELAATLRRGISAADPEAAAYNFRSMDDVIYDSVAGYRITATLLVLFAVLALLLAGFGLYGIVSYSVTERKREFAIRMALGAQPATLIGMIFQQSMVTTAVGTVFGLGGAFYLSHLLTNLLYGISGANAPALAMAITLLAGVASVATLASVVRVVRVDPMLPLREE